MWSCVVFVRPSSRRLIERRKIPYKDDPDCDDALAATFLLVPG